MIVPPIVPSRPSRARLHVTRVRRQRDERRDERGTRHPAHQPAMSDQEREAIRQAGAQDGGAHEPSMDFPSGYGTRRYNRKAGRRSS